MLKDVEWRTENRPAIIDELDSLQLISEKAVIEQHINMRRISRDVHAYFDAFDNAEAILQPYVAIDNLYISPYQLLLDDLLYRTLL
jgi:hypothetical protein